MRAALFPGQGTQRPGMGEHFRNLSRRARAVFELASDVLDRDVEALCFRSTPEVLRDTRNAQVAVVVTSLAALEVAREIGFSADVVAGHSVGEMAALVAAEVVDAETGIRATARRAQMMGAMPPVGGMCAVLGLTSDQLEEICESASTVQSCVVVAVHNAPQNIVLSGDLEALGVAVGAVRREGAKVRPLDVSHAFHSPLMAPVAAQWEEYLATLELRDPAVPLVGNVSARLLTTASEVRAELGEQLTRAVMWSQTIETLRSSGVSLAVEVGDSRVLAAFSRNAMVPLRTLSLVEPRSMRALEDDLAS